MPGRRRGESPPQGTGGGAAAGKSLDEETIRLTVTAHVRHTETLYDELLAGGQERREAREQVKEDVLVALNNRVLGEPTVHTPGDF